MADSEDTSVSFVIVMCTHLAQERGTKDGDLVASEGAAGSGVAQVKKVS